MTTQREVACWRAVGAVVIAASVTACGLLPMTSAGTTQTLTLPAPRSSVLVIVTDQDSSTALQITSTLLDESARAGEHVIVVGDREGAILGSSTAPAPPSQRAPEPPAPLPGHPTSFQKARCTYSEIVWLGAGWTASTRANANRTTGLPNSYGAIPESGAFVSATTPARAAIAADPPACAAGFLGAELGHPS